MLRYSKLTDEQVLKRLMQVVGIEGTPHNDAGLEALIFTAEGDMRQALNNAQATHAGFGLISSENVFKVRRHSPLTRRSAPAHRPVLRGGAAFVRWPAVHDLPPAGVRPASSAARQEGAARVH